MKRILGFLFIASASVTSQFSYSSEPAVTSVIQNKRGIRALESKNTKEAVGYFSEAQVESPDFPELQYNTGVAQIENSFDETEDPKTQGGEEKGKKAVKIDPAEIQRSIQSFRGSAIRARELGKKDLEALSWFNQGVVLGAAKQFPEARESYVRAIDAAKAAGDRGVETLANSRKNLELLLLEQKQEKQKQQQQQKEDQDSEKKDQGSKQDSDKKESDGKDSQDSQSGKGDKKESQKKSGSGSDDPSSKPNPSGSEESLQEAQARQAKAFESKNLSTEDAEQVMSDLSLREKELRAKLRRQKSGRSKSSEKDW